MVMNPVDRIQTVWIRILPDPNMFVSGWIRIPKKTLDIRPDLGPDPVHLYFQTTAFNVAVELA